jgi:UPF0755 protein
MSKRRRSVGLGCGLLFLLVLCSVGVLGGVVFFYVPGVVKELYGPPSVQLGIAQRITLEWQLFNAQDDLLGPLDIQGGEKKFSIRMGESAISVAERLQDAGLVRDADHFRIYLVYAGLDTGIQAGDYQLSPRMTAIEVATALQDATPQTVEFNILPGWRVEEIAASLPTSGLDIAPEGFLQVVQHPPVSVKPDSGLPQGWDGKGSLEGLLLPGTYQVARATRADELVRAFIAQFTLKVTQDLRDAYTQQGLDLRQAVTLASMVQREAMVVEEQPLIASVFYNRIAANMKFESDPTVQYAIGFNVVKKTWWTNPLSLNDLKVNSAYNTYQVAGFPPGPISNPGFPALRAVAYPAKTPYYYFRAACDGSGKHNFSKTYQEHLQNECP